MGFAPVRAISQSNCDQLHYLAGPVNKEGRSWYPISEIKTNNVPKETTIGLHVEVQLFTPPVADRSRERDGFGEKFATSSTQIWRSRCQKNSLFLKRSALEKPTPI